MICCWPSPGWPPCWPGPTSAPAATSPRGPGHCSLKACESSSARASRYVSLRVDRVLPDLAAPDVFDGNGLAESEVVVRRDGSTDVHHEIRRRPQIAGDRLPAARPALRTTVSVLPRQVVRIDPWVPRTDQEVVQANRVTVAANGVRDFWRDVVEVADKAEQFGAVFVEHPRRRDQILGATHQM